MFHQYVASFCFRIRKSLHLLIASQDGYLYLHSMNLNEGGVCNLIKQFKLTASASEPTHANDGGQDSNRNQDGNDGGGGGAGGEEGGEEDETSASSLLQFEELAHAEFGGGSSSSSSGRQPRQIEKLTLQEQSEHMTKMWQGQIN